MECMTDYKLQVKECRRRVRAQMDAIITLKGSFAKEAQYQYRYDQARSLDSLKERMELEIYNIKRMEKAAYNGFIKGTLIAGFVQLAIVSLIAVVSHSREHPLSVGARLAQNSLERTAPFGTVIVAVGPGGVPDDAIVIPISQWAREQERAESEIITALEASYRVMTPDDFFLALDELKEKVVNGTVNLPTPASSIEWYHEGLPQNSTRKNL